MLISTSHRFLFVHVPKTGGTSMENALAPFSRSHKEWGLEQHSSALEAKEKLGTLFGLLHKIAVIRNPWDLEVSLFHYNRKMLRMGHPNSVWKRDYEFPEFIRHRALIRRMHGGQWRFLFDLRGRLLVDQILRFESLSEDFQDFCRRVGLEITLPHDNSSGHAHYSEYYDEETRDMVAQYADKEIREFGYRFEAKKRVVPNRELVS